MLMLALALATMPQPIGATLPGDLGAFSVLYSETRPARTRLDLTVDVSGQPVRCDVAMSDGMGLLDRTACDLLMHRAHFSPARDSAGTPVTAVVRQDFTVNRELGVRRAGGPAETAREVDFALSVDHSPQPGAMMVADVLVMTDGSGHVTTCDVARSSGSAALDRLACRQMTTTAFTAGVDRQQHPVPALRAVSVGFTADPVTR